MRISVWVWVWVGVCMCVCGWVGVSVCVKCSVKNRRSDREPVAHMLFCLLRASVQNGIKNTLQVIKLLGIFDETIDAMHHQGTVITAPTLPLSPWESRIMHPKDPAPPPTLRPPPVLWVGG